MRVLAITVGGSPDPVVQSIRDHSPDFVLFFVTKGPNGGSRVQLTQGPSGGPGILTETRVPDGKFREVVIEHYDDLAYCYKLMRDTLRATQEEFPGSEFIADYTGGTKSMSAALSMAAARLKWKIYLVQSIRSDLNRARLEGTAMQSANPFLLDEVAGQVRVLFQARDYEGAAHLLREGTHDFLLGNEARDALTKALNLLKGLARWDRFEYAGACENLRAIPDACAEILPHLDRLAKFAQSGSCPPYALVWDLVGNAEGRAAQGQHEDAILRLYRAVELLAQARLHKNYDLDTGDLDLKKIPGPLREELAARCSGREKVTAGLVDAYRILAALGDPLGKLYESVWDKRIRDLLSLRNKAFMEHGFRPLGEEEWRKAREIARNFLAAGAEAIKVRMEIPSPPTWEEVAALLPT